MITRIPRTMKIAARCILALTTVTIAAPTIATGADGFTPIHQANQMASSAVAEFWRSQAAVGATAAAASEEPAWQTRTDSAYLTVYAHYCAPTFRDRAAMAVKPDSMELALYADRLRVDYNNDCRAFYLGEIATRIDSPTGLAQIETEAQ